MRTFRNASYLYLGLALMLAGVVLLVAPVAAGEAIALILTAPVGLGWAAIGWFFLVRPRVTADACGVTIVNRGTTIHLKWAEIDRFDAAGTLLVYRKGQEKPMAAWAVQAANLARMTGRRSHADNVAADLNALLAAATTSSTPALSFDDMAAHKQMRWAAFVVATLALSALVVFLLVR